MNGKTILIATLGGQPQVITFTLDLLRAQGEAMDEVHLLYLHRERPARALKKIEAEFEGGAYAGHACRLFKHPIRWGDEALSQALRPAEVEAVRQTFFDLLYQVKDQASTVHLSLTGGPRILALIGLSAAAQHLTLADRLWHLYTPDGLKQQAEEGAQMHAPPGCEGCLVAVPFVPWASFFPALKGLLNLSGQELAEAELGVLSAPERQYCETLWKQLTDAEKQILDLLARSLTRSEVMNRLHISENTLKTHLKHIFQKARAIWPETGDPPIDQYFLRSRFHSFLHGQKLG